VGYRRGPSAVEKGYRILEIHAVQEYDITRYDPVTGEDGLLVEYINTFLKLKAEANGFPSWVRTPEDQETYIGQFYQCEGIRLYRDSIQYNAANWVCINSI
jgi:hypothetical protein